MVRDIVAAQQAQGALTGTPGSVHTRHTGKPLPSYGPGFFGGTAFKRLFMLGVLVVTALFVAVVVVSESLAEHGGETVEQTETPPGSGNPGAGISGG